MFFPNANGASQTYSTNGGGIDLTGPFFQSMGTNGRTCGTCHQPSDGMSVSASHIQQRFEQTQGEDPIFRTVDGSNCDHSIDVSTLNGRSAAYSLLRTRGLFRIGIAVPANAYYRIVSVQNPYGCNESDTISMYRRPLPATNLQFLSAVMVDGRESTPLTGTQKIVFANYPGSLVSDLAHQSVDATTGHAQGDGSRPTPAEQQEIVNFEMSLATAQVIENGVGRLDAQGANGHSFPTPLNIGAGDPNPDDSSVNMGGLDIRYLPSITVCRADPITGGPTSECKTTTDLGQALIDGKFDHVGKIKGPILRGLSARAPYFHNGSARNLLDIVRFYEGRFGLVLTPQEESDLVAFLSSL
jgi:hypothetical protein